MADKNWFHETIKEIRQNGYEAQVVKNGMAIQVERETYLLPSPSGNAYSLARPLGRISRDNLEHINTLSGGSVSYTIITFPTNNDALIDIAVRIGEFPRESLDDLSAQEELLEQVAMEAGPLVKKYNPGDLPVDKIENCTVLKPVLPYFHGKNHDHLKQFLAGGFSNRHSPRLFLLNGTHGTGKKTVLGNVLAETGSTGVMLENEGGQNAYNLAEAYRALFDKIRKINGAVIVATDIVGNMLLSRKDSSFDALAAQLLSIAHTAPVIIISSRTHLSLPEASSVYMFEEESRESVRSIVSLYYDDPHLVNSTNRKPGDPAEPLYTLQKLAAVHDGELQNQTGLPSIPAFEDCFSIMKSRIAGQDNAIAKILTYIKSMEKFPASIDRGPTNLSILAAGPSGVGKTQTAKEIAQLLGVNYILVPCNEAISAEFFHSRLTGAAAGYVGYGDSAAADRIRAGSREEGRFGTVIIIDEIEEAPLKVRHLFLSMMQEGEIRTGKRIISLENNILFFTTNHGVKELTKSAVGFNTAADRKENLEDIFLADGEFEKKFLSRINLFLDYQSIDSDQALEIIKIRLRDIIEMSNDIRIEINMDDIAEKIRDQFALKIRLLGVRIVEGIVREHILGPLAILKEQGRDRALVSVKNGLISVE